MPASSALFSWYFTWPTRDPFIRHRAVQIGPDRRHEFRLLGGAVADLRIFLHVGEGGLDHRIRPPLAAAHRIGTSRPIPDSWPRNSGTCVSLSVRKSIGLLAHRRRALPAIDRRAALRLGRLRGASRQRHQRAHDHDANGISQPRPSLLARPHAHTQIQIAIRGPRIGRARRFVMAAARRM